MKKIGCFISPHGFGHATRVCAVIEALQNLTNLETHIFTTVDRSIFDQSLSRYLYTPQVTDVGFIQHDAFRLDIGKTISALNNFLPFSEKLVDRLAMDCREMSFILCDISSLGIAVGAKADIPTVLIENFTWDWLYSFYEDHYPELTRHSAYLDTLYQRADYHIKTAPLCKKGKADLFCGPIYRTVRKPDNYLRTQFSCRNRKIVLITLGGIGFSPVFIDMLSQHPDYLFLIGGQDEDARLGSNVHTLSKNSQLYHPDLINGSDIIVFKSGYSTLAECYQSGRPSICIRRNGFAESEILESFAVENMSSILISQDDFASGRWLEVLSEISTNRIHEHVENGAEKAARFLRKIL